MIPRQTSQDAAVEINQWEPKQILVPTDFSELSRDALLYAAAFTECFGGKLSVLHVLEPVRGVYAAANKSLEQRLYRELCTSSENRLRQVVKEACHNGELLKTEVRCGNPVEEIIQFAEEQHPDLIVMASHGRTGLKHVFIGSVAEGIVRHAPCPVLVVRQSPKRGDSKKPLNLKNILVAVDFSETSNLALRYAEEIAAGSGANLIAVHVTPIHCPTSEYGVLECPQLDAELLESGRRHLVDLVDEVKKKGLPVKLEIRQGKAGVEITNIASECQADLIILGTRGLSGFKHMIIGSTAEYVVRHAACPVLAIRDSLTNLTAQTVATRQSSRRQAQEEDAKQMIIDTHPFLSDMSPEELDIILKGATISTFEAGDVIFREGDYAKKMFLIHEGKVALESHSKDKSVTIQSLGSGEVLGWSWLFPPFAWHFQARALEKTVALELDGAHILVASENDYKFGHHVMKRIVQVLIDRLQATRSRLLQASEKVEVELGETL